MIYFDNAATSFPKPEDVYKAIDNCLRYECGNPGRSGHKMALSASRIIFETREKIANFLGVKNSSRIIFTSNATDSLNLGIKGLLKKGDHVITSSMEHNSVLRPLRRLENEKLISVTRVKARDDGYLFPDSISKNIRENTKLIVITHASNVVGTINPIDAIGAIAKKNKIKFMIDAAQTVGAIQINIENIDLLAAPGHKSLFGPQGTGFLYIKEGINLTPLKEGGTGSQSHEDNQPKILPERYESGTSNTPGIAGLGAGISFIEKIGIEKIRLHEMELTDYFLKKIKEIPEIIVYGSNNALLQMPVISFEIKNIDSGELGTILNEKYDIMTRVGLHCAPFAHKTIKTYPRGTVRIGLGYFNTLEEVDFTIKCFKKIIANNYLNIGLHNAK